jgi:hypothetical protein
VLLAALLLHTVLAKLLFAGADSLAASTAASADQWRAASDIMFYEGDLIELALVIAFVVQVEGAARRRRARLVAAGG